jgi:hypothetical protein
MKTHPHLGLDELMIVNPGPEEVAGFFLGEDGTLYQVEGIAASGEVLSEYFLSDDGLLYRLEGFPDLSGPQLRGQEQDAAEATGRFFLGEDGRLYEVIS